MFQVQEPPSRSITTREFLSFSQNLLNFIITKYLKQEVDGTLTVCVDERSPRPFHNWGYIYFINMMWSKGKTLLPARRSVLWNSIKELFLLPKFDNSGPSVTGERHLSQSHDYEVIRSLPPEANYTMEPFEWGLPGVQIWYF